MTLVDTSQLNIAAQVNEVDISNVQQGQAAQFTVSAYPTTNLNATVSSLDTVGETSSNIVSYTVTLTVDQTSIPSNVHLYPGMTATVNITTQQRIGSLLMPTSALTFASTFQATRNTQGSSSGGGGGLVEAMAVEVASVEAMAVVNKATQQDHRAAQLGHTLAPLGLHTGTTGSTTGTTGSTTGTTGSTTGSQSTTSSTQGTQQTVYELENGTPVPVSITTGLKSGTEVEVLSGLQEGDEVIIGQTGGGARGGMVQAAVAVPEAAAVAGGVEVAAVLR